MAWFHETLKDMEKAIEKEDWQEVKRILQQHNYHLDRDAPEIEHDLSKIGRDISDYGQHLSQISAILRSQLKSGHGDKVIMKLKVKDAIYCALKFEKTIKHLIKEGKFLE